MKPISRKRAPKNLPTAVSDLVAEGGNVLASDDARVLTVAPAEARRSECDVEREAAPFARQAAGGVNSLMRTSIHPNKRLPKHMQD